MRFSDYKNITVEPFRNLTSADDLGIAEQIQQKFLLWVEDSELSLSEDGEIICEAEVLEAHLERGFFQKVNPLYEKTDELFVELELVISESYTEDIICKIRHGAVGNEMGELIERTVTGLISYFKSHL